MDNITPKLKLFHADLSKVTRIAEPLLPESTHWVCYGATVNWLEATLTGKKEEQRVYSTLNDMFKYIHQDSQEKHLSEKAIVFAKKIAHRQLPEFFSPKFISQYQGHTLQPTQFNYTDIGIIAPSMQELENYLLEIESHLEAQAKQPCVGFIIQTNQHTIGLYYQHKTKSWISFNVSRLYPETSYHFNLDAQNTSKCLFFDFQETKENYLPFCITAVSIAEHADLISTLTSVTDKFITLENKKTSHWFNCFWLACYFGYNKLIKLHIEQQALENINIPILPFSERYTPLHIACHNGNIATVKLLLAHGAQESINLTTIKGETSLYAASARGHNNIVNALLKNGALTKLNNELFIACQMGHTKTVSLLLAQKAVKEHINTLNPETQTTCLWVSCLLEHHDIIQILLENGAALSINIVDQNGETPLSIAIEGKKSEVIKLLSPYLPKNDGFQQINIPALLIGPQFDNIQQKADLKKSNEKNAIRTKIKFS